MTIDVMGADDNDSKPTVHAAIQLVHSRVQWKPGKGRAHLRTRQQYGHVPATATLQDYEAIIQSIVRDGGSEVYLYRWRDADLYIAVVGEYSGRHWLVMFGIDGVMETAFPPTDPDEYLADPRFEFCGPLRGLEI